MRAALAAGAGFLVPEGRQAVARFVGIRQNPDGGFRGRTAATDLYYTLFGLECAASLELTDSLEAARPFIDSIGDGAGLDLVHLACLARCRSVLGGDVRSSGAAQSGMLAHVECYRAADGGYASIPGADTCGVYASFLGAFAYDALGRRVPHPLAYRSGIKQMMRGKAGGKAGTGWVGEATSVVVAGVTLAEATRMRRSVRELADVLQSRRDGRGAFRAAPRAPGADLLSTATALYALKGTAHDAVADAGQLLDFIESLWHESGGFVALENTDTPDLEYTFYGLLAIGALVGT